MFMLQNKNLFVNKKGYTIIELLVAMFIFTIVIIVVFSLFTMAIRGQRRIIAQQNIQENARFLIAFIAKEIRMSVISSSQANGTSASLTLTRSDGGSVVYTFISNKLKRTSSISDDFISSDDVLVTGNFYVEGMVLNDDLQPKVTIVLGIQGVGAKVEEKAKINVQTTLSPRNLDL